MIHFPGTDKPDLCRSLIHFACRRFLCQTVRAEMDRLMPLLSTADPLYTWLQYLRNETSSHLFLAARFPIIVHRHGLFLSVRTGDTNSGD